MMAVVGRRKEDGRRLATGDVFIHSSAVHFMGVGESFGMPSWVVGEVSDVLEKASGAALQYLVGLVASTEDDLGWLLQVPPNAAFGAVDADIQAALDTGGYLRNSSISMDPIVEAKQ
jgi:hypothetical protein